MADPTESPDLLARRNLTALLIRDGLVIDPFRNRSESADLAIVDGRIARPEDLPAGTEVLDAAGLIVCPGLMDIHVHLREPGQTHKETIRTGTAAAAAGGFTFVACMPNTEPPLDTPEIIQQVITGAKEAGYCTVGPVAAITRGRRGTEVTPVDQLAKAGAVAFSDDGTGVEDDRVMLEAFEAVKTADSLVIQHCEYAHLSDGGVMHAGDVSRSLKVPGLDRRSEEAMIERDIGLVRETGARYHVAHISTAGAVEMVRAAKAEGLPVTTEVCTHHLVLTEEACRKLEPNTKMHPPLREAADVSACRQGLLDGTIDCIVTDHAPHAADEKAKGFLQAPPGIVGLETAVSLACSAMVESGLANWTQIIRWFTKGPADVLGVSRPTIAPGAEADLSIIDPNARWVVDSQAFRSLGRNTPFDGWQLPGKTLATIRGSVLHTAENALLPL